MAIDKEDQIVWYLHRRETTRKKKEVQENGMDSSSIGQMIDIKVAKEIAGVNGPTKAMATQELIRINRHINV